MRESFVIGNWKMNLSLKKSVHLAQSIRAYASKKKLSAHLVLCPSLPMIASVKEAVRRSKIQVGSQNVFFEQEGAFTGEVAISQLKSIGVTHVIVGHSERRIYFKETDTDINKKVVALVKAGITPILCVGEKWEERRVKRTAEVVARQVKVGLDGVHPENVIIAYEPVWAISTFQTSEQKISATPMEAAYVHAYIRKLIERMASASVADKISILYGGSVTAKNSKEFQDQEDIDGFLVGGASLKPLEFIRIADSIR